MWWIQAHQSWQRADASAGRPGLEASAALLLAAVTVNEGMILLRRFDSPTQSTLTHACSICLSNTSTKLA